MPSSFSWVDFSEAERRRTQEVLDLLHERETRDELGIGTVRDAVADLLFPGTSTLHTRARYFLFIPWVYERLASRGVESGEVARKARKAELDLIAPLKQQQDREGLIGATAEERLKRLPSEMYWAGLGAWGIRRFPGSLSQYHRAFRRAHDDPHRSESSEDGEGQGRNPWDPALPEAPDEFPEQVSFALSRSEAEYLQHRVQSIGPTLMAELVRRGTPIEATALFWERSDAEGWRPALQAQVAHARCLSEVMHGAALLYNLLLAEAIAKEEWIGAYQADLGDWVEQMRARRAAHLGWDREAFWAFVATSGAHTPLRTRAFIDGWIELALAGDSPRLLDSSPARELVRRREEQVKRGRARLGNASALARWGGAAGAAQLNFRWNRVQSVTSDILRGLAASA